MIYIFFLLKTNLRFFSFIILSFFINSSNVKTIELSGNEITETIRKARQGDQKSQDKLVNITLDVYGIVHLHPKLGSNIDNVDIFSYTSDKGDKLGIFFEEYYKQWEKFKQWNYPTTEVENLDPNYGEMYLALNRGTRQLAYRHFINNLDNLANTKFTTKQVTSYLCLKKNLPLDMAGYITSFLYHLNLEPIAAAKKIQGDLKMETRNRGGAEVLYQQAAELGCPRAVYMLFVVNSLKTSEQDSQKQAADYLKRAADQGVALAQYELGLSYHSQENKDLAFEWMEKAAQQNYIQAIGYMARMDPENKEKWDSTLSNIRRIYEAPRR